MKVDKQELKKIMVSLLDDLLHEYRSYKEYTNIDLNDFANWLKSIQ